MGKPQIKRSAATAAQVASILPRSLAWLSKTLQARFGADIGAELSQEAALRIAVVCPADVRNPSAYLRRVALNVVRDQYRRRAARGGGNAVPIDDVFDEPALSYAADQEQALLLKQVILSMPELYRGVFLLNRFVGLSYQEIAVRLDISVKTVEWRMGRALAHCVAQLRD